MGGNIAHVTVDLKTNILYSYTFAERRLYITKYPSFISSGSTASSTTRALLPDTVYVDDDPDPVPVTPYPNDWVIYDGKVYMLASDTSSNDYGTFLYKADFDECESSDNEIPDGVKISLSYGSITDMYYEDGYLYLLVSQYKIPTDSYSNPILATSSPIYSRGFIAKYDISSDSIVEMIGGTTDGTPTNTGKLYLYNDRLTNPPFLYRDDAFSIPFTIDKDFSEFMSGTADTVFPEFFIPSDSQKAFRNPSKIIAIKPKKLVIADDGIAFYTDTDGAWNYKNSDRIVTVSLNNFAIESINSTNSKFAKVESEPFVSENEIIGSSHFGQEQTYQIYQQDYGYNPAAASDMKVAIRFKQN